MIERVNRFNAREAEEVLAIMKRFDAIVERTEEENLPNVIPLLTKLMQQYFDFTNIRMTTDEIHVCVRILYRRAKSECNMTLEKISRSELVPASSSIQGDSRPRPRATLRLIEGGRKDPKPMKLRGEFKL